MTIDNLNHFELQSMEVFLADDLSILDYKKEKQDDGKVTIFLPPGILNEEVELINDFVHKLKSGRRRRL